MPINWLQCCLLSRLLSLRACAPTPHGHQRLHLPSGLPWLFRSQRGISWHSFFLITLCPSSHHESHPTPSDPHCRTLWWKPPACPNQSGESTRSLLQDYHKSGQLRSYSLPQHLLSCYLPKLIRFGHVDELVMNAKESRGSLKPWPSLNSNQEFSQKIET